MTSLIRLSSNDSSELVINTRDMRQVLSRSNCFFYSCFHPLFPTLFSKLELTLSPLSRGHSSSFIHLVVHSFTHTFIHSSTTLTQLTRSVKEEKHLKRLLWITMSEREVQGDRLSHLMSGPRKEWLNWMWAMSVSLKKRGITKDKYIYISDPRMEQGGSYRLFWKWL